MKLDLYLSLGSKNPGLLFAALCSLLLVLAPTMARADINLVAPSRTIDPAEPLRLSLMVTGESDSRDYALPEVLRVSLTPDLGAAANVELQRATPVPDTITLRSGEFMRIDYVGAVPRNLRGRVRIDAVDMDAPAMLVQLSTSRTQAQPGAPSSAVDNVAQLDTSPVSTPAPVTTLSVRSDDDPNRQVDGRLSFFEPMFFAVGDGSDANAKMQLSFKLRLYEPTDKTSRDFVDNMYFGYTQSAFWDLTSYSKPFIDTNYMPSFFYYIPDTDWRVDGNAVGLAAGIEHESNGKDEPESRSLDVVFVRPYFTFGDRRDFHWTASPNLYAYIEKSENSDIAKYRGYGDFHLSYGKDNDWQAAWILRKGTSTEKFSAELQATYPINQWYPGVSGYLMLQAFTGYGEYLLDYNEREPWSVRIGYAISR
jgi:outer membrane phospholipase A